MASAEDTYRNPPSAETLTEDQAERMLAAMNEVIRAGEEMRKLRAEMIQLFAGLGWTQERIARLADMSQPAVSKQVAKYKPAGPLPPGELALDQHDVPWLEGRLWGLAEAIAEVCDGTARCARSVDALARGRKRFTPQNVDALRRLVEEDLRAHRERLPAAFQAAYDTIGRGLDVPAKATAKASVKGTTDRAAQGTTKGSTKGITNGAAQATPTASPSVRRTLAHRIQRDRLEDASGTPRGGAAQR